MKRKILAVLLTLCTLLVLYPVPVSAAAAAAKYHPDDIAVLNAIAIAHPELGWGQAPEDGSGAADGWGLSIIWTQNKPAHVTMLILQSQGLTGSLDVSALTQLRELWCADNALSSIDASDLKALEKLSCAQNALTSLDVSGATALGELHCAFNKLTELDLGGLSSLSYVDCSGNELTSLNVTGCTALETLDCEYNLLSSLEVNGLTALDQLYCSYNLLTGTLDLRNTALSILYCNNNRLSGLNLDGLTALSYLECYLNQLTSLDVSDLASLGFLYCFSNKLTTLDVRELSELYFLDCEDNQLTSLHVSGLANLLYLYCRYNNLTELDVYGTGLECLWVSNNCLADQSKVTGKDITWDDDDFRYDTQYPEYIDVTFSAEQTGGVSGTTDSTGIVLTFSQAVEDLSETAFWVWGASGDADTGDLICSDESNVSDSWTIELGEVYAEEDLQIRIMSFANYRMPKEPQTTMIYKASEQKTYNVTVHGGTAVPETAEAGTEIEITANPPAAGKRFTGWIVNSGGAVLEDETAVVTTFKMPASDVDITANYEDVYYEITVHSGTADPETAILGTDIEITANPPAAGKRFTGWIVNSGGAVLEDETAEITWFKMPASDVEVTANYEDVYYNVTVHGGTAVPETAILGTDIEITANPAAAGKHFSRWIVNSGGAVLEDETADVTCFKMPASDVDITANYEDDPEPDPYRIAVFRTGWQTEYYLEDEVALAARAEGGTPPYRYQFYTLAPDDTKTVLSQYRYSNIYSWTPEAAGDYRVGVEVKDATGQILHQVKEVSILDVPLELAVFRTGWQAEYYLGDTVALAARAEGGVPPHRYQFYTVDEDGVEHLLRDYLNRNIYDWEPAAVGTWQVGVRIEDLRGASVSEVRNVTVKEVPPLEIAVFRAGYKNRYDSGEAIPLAARAEGGREPYRYKFYCFDADGNETVLRDYAYSNIYSWTPEFDGDYEVHVSVKDKYGTVIDEQRNVTVGPLLPA